MLLKILSACPGEGPVYELPLERDRVTSTRVISVMKLVLYSALPFLTLSRQEFLGWLVLGACRRCGPARNAAALNENPQRRPAIMTQNAKLFLQYWFRASLLKTSGSI